ARRGIRGEVDHHRFTVPPVAADLQYRGAGQPPVRKQRSLAKRGLARARLDRGGDTRQSTKERIVPAEGKRDERGARLDDLQTELACEVVGETGGPHLGDRGAAGRDDEAGSGEAQAPEITAESRVAVL